MLEIEVKFFDVDRAVVERKLKKLGAKKIFGPALFRATHFNHPDLGKRYYSLLRMREEGEGLALTVKNKKRGGKFKIEVENEVHVSSDAQELRALLEVMGFRVSRETEKMRTEYKIGGMKVEIDQYPSLPAYVEIEGSNKRSMRALAAKLGFDFKDASTENASQYIKRMGLDPYKLLFKKRP